MNKIFKVLLGFNLISTVHLARLNIGHFLRACGHAYSVAKDEKRALATHSKMGQIPVVNLGEILDERKPSITLSVMRYEEGMLPSDQAMALLSILVAENPSEVLEIGTFMGHTTRQMAENLHHATIHTVDLPEDFTPGETDHEQIPKDDFHLIERRVVGREFAGKACADHIKQHFADTATWDFHEAGGADFFFIDGSHTYEYCKSDSEKCYDLCGGKGVFLWHDCNETHPGVVDFLIEWRALGRDVRRIAGTPIAYWKSV